MNYTEGRSDDQRSTHSKTIDFSISQGLCFGKHGTTRPILVTSSNDNMQWIWGNDRY